MKHYSVLVEKTAKALKKPSKTLELLKIGRKKFNGLKRCKFIHNAVIQFLSFRSQFFGNKSIRHKMDLCTYTDSDDQLAIIIWIDSDAVKHLLNFIIFRF